MATIAGAVLSGGDDEGSSPSSADNTPAKPKADANKKKEPKAKKEPKEEPPAAPAPAEQPSDSGSYDAARGAELNDAGLRPDERGRLRGRDPGAAGGGQLVPAGHHNLNYAYALFNLGKSLRLAGRPEEAIPVLEKRLEIPNQTETVQAELDQAKRDAGKG